MIIVSYPVATGGTFVCAVIGMMLDDENPPKIKPNGSVIHPVWPNTITPIHESDIKLLLDSNPGCKIVCITIDPDDYATQAKNFQKKCIPNLWCEDWYDRFKSESYPPFNPDVSKMPDYIIQDIINVNRTYIKNWCYVFPEDMTDVLILNFKDIMSGRQLVEKLQTFFNINTVDETVYNYISNYQSLQ